MFIMTDESGRLVGAGTSGESLVKSLQNFQPLAKASPAPKRVTSARQKPKTPTRSHPWRYQAEKQKSRLDDLAKTLSAIARGEPLKSRDDFKPGKPLRKSFSPIENMGELMRQIPNEEYRQPHYVRMLVDMGVL